MKAVWIADPKNAFVKAQLLDNGRVSVDGEVRDIPKSQIFQVNPSQFDKANDIAELTFLNEASVVNNLSTRYQEDKIYTYSGLFLVAVNPYKQLNTYGPEAIQRYVNKQRDETDPHIYAVAEASFRRMLETRENQSILITGESGAGKTENTKKTIQYLSAVTSKGSTTEAKILQTNPVLEAFGNAQTVRNNNSSRFGKFIRIEFSKRGICGASIDWYLLEKSRVLVQSNLERNYHIFYYLLKGADQALRTKLGLASQDPQHYRYLSGGAPTIAGVDDASEFKNLLNSLETVGFSAPEIQNIWSIVAAVLLLGNIEVTAMTTDQGRIPSMEQVRKVCKLLGVKEDTFAEVLVKPKIKAGREIVSKAVSADQIRHSINALAMTLYERLFGYIVERLNAMLHPTQSAAVANWIGVLDIAGFEIFENNSFEQLCINYTNEKLQQFFNHHMFVLEQAEYVKEEIDWEYVDYSIDLQPTIDLIEKQNPMGIFACLDEDCVMPRSTDKTFTEKLNSKWTDKNVKFKPSRLNQGFIVSHYAAQVEYSTDGWLEKNKDPLNDQITDLLSKGSSTLVASIFSGDSSSSAPNLAPGGTPASPKKKGIFRTVAQRHKEQLTGLMNQMSATHPHFVRCIVPNQHKTPGKFDNLLVLDQLRCNGVLEGIRIARSGFPNRVEFKEFKERYQALYSGSRIPQDGQLACDAILKSMELNPSSYKIGTTKVFFKNGVLAELEELREKLIAEQTLKVQSLARGLLVRQKVQRQIFRNHAAKTLAQTARTYLNNRNDNWWKTYQHIRPLLSSTESKENNRKDVRIQRLEQNLDKARTDYSSLETTKLKLATQVKDLEGTQQSLETQATEKNEIIKSLENELKTLAKQLEEQSTVASKELEQMKTGHATVIDKLTFDLKRKSEELEAFESKFTGLDKDHTSTKTQMAALIKSHDTLKETHTKLSTDHQKLVETSAKLDKSNKEADKHARASKAQADELTAQIAALESEVKQLKHSAAQASKEIAAKLETVENVNKELAESKKRASALEKELEKLKAAHHQSREIVDQHESLKSQVESSKLQFSARLNEYVAKLEAAEQENKKLKSRALDAQVDASKLNETNTKLAKLEKDLSDANVDPRTLASELKNAARFNQVYTELSALRRILDSNGFSTENFGDEIAKSKQAAEQAQKATSRAQRAESNVKRLEAEALEHDSKIAQIGTLEQRLAKTEALNKAQAREIDSLKAQIQQAQQASAEATHKLGAVSAQAKTNSRDQIDDLEGQISTHKSRNEELESEVARFRQKFMEIEQAHGTLAEITRKLEKTQQEKADALAANTRLMFGMEQQRRSSRELAETVNRSQSAKSLESEIKVLQLRLLKSERARKVAESNAAGHNGDELLKERDEAVKALAALKSRQGGSRQLSDTKEPDEPIEVRKRRPLRDMSNGQGTSPGKKASVTTRVTSQATHQTRLSSLEKTEKIAQLHDSLKEEVENAEIYRQRANDYQAKTQQAEVIMRNLQLSEKALEEEIEDLRAKQQNQVEDKDRELVLKNDTIRRLRRELDSLKGDYQQHILMESNNTRKEAQQKISELIESLNEVTGERDVLLAAKLKLEKRAQYKWSDSDPLESRKKELEENLKHTRRDLSSTKHELDELRAKADLNDTRTKNYEDRLSVADQRNRELMEELDELRGKGFDTDLTVKQLHRELDALKEKNLRLEKFRARSEKADSRVFI